MALDTSTQTRAFGIEGKTVNEERRTVEVAFSSEAPVERQRGIEILDHSRADLERLNDGAPVLVNHDANDQVGVVENARIDGDKVGRATIRFSSSARGQEIFNDIKEGIRKKMSVGYQYTSEERSEGDDRGSVPAYRYGFAPFELTIASIPADNSVGVGRSKEESGGGVPANNEEPAPQTNNQNRTMVTPDEGGAATATPENKGKVEISEAERSAIMEEAIKSENERQVNIRKFAQRASIADSVVQEAIEKRTSFNTFTRTFAEEGYATVTPSAQKPELEIGMNEKERKRFSIVKAIRDICHKDKLEGLEREISEHCAKVQKVDSNHRTLNIPLDIMASEVNGSRRDLEAGTASEGGYSVQTDLGGMIGLLRNRTKVLELGATHLTGLVGNLQLPRQDGAATASWVDEEGSVPETAQTYGQVSFTPNRLAARTVYSDQLVRQSSISTEQFVRNDLTRVTAIEVDRAALHGSGASNQPLGLDGISGTGGLTFGGAPTWADIVEFETDVEGSNADIGSMAFLISASTKGKWKTTLKAASTSATYLIEGNEANGYPVHVTNNITGNIVFFGVWSQLAIATWGMMSLIVDPYSKAQTGQHVVTACSFHDVGGLQPSAFSISSDAGNQ